MFNKNIKVLLWTLIIVLLCISYCSSENADGWNIDYTINYSIGKRVEGDRVVYKDHYHRNQTDPFTMTHNPGSHDNNHTYITYAELFARQTTPIGKIKILQGGVGLREIYFAVSTFNTTLFDLTTYIYGYN
ncbi:uncharacterized protein LOC113366160 [Ctenocephalides felis]|uniref:uncharacterized protein LOC113366160 n=1 Tax=Ctenocephalides felis TaxID=7515 RepID=UPI000E6E2C62|nr:uncharacterized protein LOC113366160 [Ctenocephalides felis]